MKYLKIIDFIGQTLIWLGLLGSSLVILASGEDIVSLFYIVLIAQFFMGCWQMISSLLFILFRSQRLRSIHFVSAWFSLGSIAFAVAIANTWHSGISTGLLIATGVVIPWGLAIFYYTITWRWMFSARPSGKFLRHVSF